jgi:hypothetical protein
MGIKWPFSSRWQFAEVFITFGLVIHTISIDEQSMFCQDSFFLYFFEKVTLWESEAGGELELGEKLVKCW